MVADFAPLVVGNTWVYSYVNTSGAIVLSSTSVTYKIRRDSVNNNIHYYEFVQYDTSASRDTVSLGFVRDSSNYLKNNVLPLYSSHFVTKSSLGGSEGSYTLSSNATSSETDDGGGFSTYTIQSTYTQNIGLTYYYNYTEAYHHVGGYVREYYTYSLTSSNIQLQALSVTPGKVTANRSFVDNFKLINHKINYALLSPELVTVAVYDIKGSLVRVLLNQRQSAGSYALEVPKQLSSGSYIVSCKAGNYKNNIRLFIAK